jgi:hypothetical protein
VGQEEEKNDELTWVVIGLAHNPDMACGAREVVRLDHSFFFFGNPLDELEFGACRCTIILVSLANLVPDLVWASASQGE